MSKCMLKIETREKPKSSQQIKNQRGNGEEVEDLLLINHLGYAHIHIKAKIVSVQMNE